MPRMHAPELEDEAWFPVSLRNALTAFLRVADEKLGLFDAATSILADVLERVGDRRVLDLCSGGGGPVLSCVAKIDGASAVLTDLYPNLPAFAEAAARTGQRVRGHETPISATDVPPSLDGVRTLFNALHHFRPDDARKILADAVEKRQAICAFEVVERSPLTLVAVALTPIAALFLVPFTRPRLSHLVLTYLVPVIPLAIGWDGIASCLRAYSLEELEALVASLRTDGYRFVVGRTRRGLFPPFRVTYLLGEPRLG